MPEVMPPSTRKALTHGSRGAKGSSSCAFPPDDSPGVATSMRLTSGLVRASRAVIAAVPTITASTGMGGRERSTDHEPHR